MKEFSVFW